jgi:apolipoprotein N-acyltransferase
MKFRLIVAIFLLVLIVSNLPSDLNKLGTIRIAAVQGGVDELGLNFNDRAYSVLQRHAKITENLEQAYDLVVWPENASDLDPIKDVRAQGIVKSVLAEKDFPLLVGAVEQRPEGPVNSSLFFDNSGTLRSRYVKQDLAPFGEYIPLRTLAEFVTPEAKSVRNFISGDQWVLHKVNDANLISVICFEILDDDHLKNGANKSEIIVNQTNNATFGRSNQAAQQLQIARSRAIELGKEILSVSTTGFTAHIDNRGQIIEEIPQFDAGYLDAEVQRYEGETWASRLNSWFWAGFLLLVMGISRAWYLADN